MAKILQASEIVKRVAVKHNVSEKMVNEILNQSIDYMDHLINVEHVPSIQLQYLGCLYFKTRERNVDITAARNNIKQTSVVNDKLFAKLYRNEKLYLNVESYLESLQGRKGFAGKRKVRHYSKPFIVAKRHGFGLPIEEIEAIQNEHNQ